MTDKPVMSQLNAWECRVLRAVVEAGYDDANTYGYRDLRSKGWVTSGRLSVHLREESFITRKTVRKLADANYLDRVYHDNMEYFHINPRGEEAISSVFPDRSYADDTAVPAEDIERLLRILSKIEDASEEERDNARRAQIVGLVRALTVLLEVPDVPKSGILSLIRDPAFANIVQLSALFAAIAAVLR